LPGYRSLSARAGGPARPAGKADEDFMTISANDTTIAPKDKRSSYSLAVIVVGLALFITNLDISIVTILMPTLARQFGTGTGEISRIILLYVLPMAALLPFAGKLSDLKGAERIFMIGLGAFTAASGLCAMAPNLVWLDIARFLQGAGAALLVANQAALIIRYVPEKDQGKIFGITSVAVGAGFAAGAPLGGFLVHALSWHWAFLVNLPIGVAAFFLCLKLFRDRRPQPADNGGTLDLVGALLSFAGLTALIAYLNLGREIGWGSAKGLVLVFGALICGVFFIRRELRIAHPLVDLSYARDRRLTVSLAVAFLSVTVFDGFCFLFPFFFEKVKEMTPDRVGLLLLVSSAPSFGLSPLAGWLSDRWRADRVTSIGTLLLLAALILFTRFDRGSAYLFQAAALIVFGASLAFIMTPNITLVMSRARPGQESMVSALSAVTVYLATIIGISLFENVFSWGSGSVTDMSRPENPGVATQNGFRYAVFTGIALTLLAVLASRFAWKKKQGNGDRD